MTEDIQSKQTHNLHIFGLIALTLSLLALSMSVTSPWILEHISPPSSTQSLEDLAVEKALSIKDKLVKGLKGEDYKDPPPEVKAKHWSDYWPLIIIVTAMLGIILGIIGFVRHESKRLTLSAVCIGVGAIIAIYALIFMAVFLLFFLVGIILDSMGLNFSP